MLKDKDSFLLIDDMLTLSTLVIDDGIILNITSIWESLTVSAFVLTPHETFPILQPMNQPLPTLSTFACVINIH